MPIYEFKCPNGHELIFLFGTNEVPDKISCPLKNCEPTKESGLFRFKTDDGREQTLMSHPMAKRVGEYSPIGV